MATSITSALGGGSGIDTKALVTDLVAAQFDTKAKALTAREEKLTAQISSLGQLKSGLNGFATALSSLISGGTLSTQPVSGDSSLFTARTATGATIGTLSRELEVRRLAAGQSLSSAPISGGPSAETGTGALVIRFGTPTVDGTGAITGFTDKAGATPVRIQIEPGQNSLVGLAAAINASGAGLSASVIGDGQSARLSVRGPTGAVNGFTITAEEGAVPGLSRFEYRSGAQAMTSGRAATDALVALDGIEQARPTNSITDLVDGVVIDLVKAEAGRTVSLSSSRPTAAIGTAVNDFVAAFNELRTIIRTETDPVTGALGGDTAARALSRQLGSLTSTALVSGAAPGAPRTLAEIGVSTNRDGSLAVDSAKLNAAIARWPDVVEAMFSPRQDSSSPLLSVTSSAGRTVPGSYTVENLVPATSGALVGAAAPNAFDTPVVIDASNKAITVVLNDGSPIELTLAEGSYDSGAALAAAFNQAVAANVSAAGRVSASWSDNRFTLRSALEGTASTVAVTGGDGALAVRLGLASATATRGTAASGSIAGKPALYSNGIFTAASDSPAAGLSLRASGSVASATIRIDLGLGAALTSLAARLTGTTSSLASAESRYAAARKDVAESQEKVAEAAERMTTQLTKTYASMEARVSAYKATQSFLEQQIAVWTKDS
ncbi:flagellar hook-associated protein 2 [Sphingomonas jejuensis]|uniref:Flagellar hook-associated protein 2 n=1 Tax=Sphingomonas jejuensis TaxID=904715 RepID=A0ABX0XND4_9SPHN|nr:flagellar filament capping protein FliD [Sphingomonas jejuensis]NJC34740.1 flagellar hook-associated protein 2 [Sphingomonas jejuensis]